MENAPKTIEPKRKHLQILRHLVQAASERILIMSCGDINSDNVVHIVTTTLAQEVHSSAGTSSPNSPGNGSDLLEGNNEVGSGLQAELFEQKVAKLVSLLGDLSHDEHVR
jgi:copper homeostasis protein CutC